MELTEYVIQMDYDTLTPCEKVKMDILDVLNKKPLLQNIGMHLVPAARPLVGITFPNRFF